MWALTRMRLRVRVRVAQRKNTSPSRVATHQDRPPSLNVFTTSWLAAPVTPVDLTTSDKSAECHFAMPARMPAARRANGTVHMNMRKAAALASRTPCRAV
jgi:hypothetical protein